MGRGRPKSEPTRPKAVRLPDRLWELLKDASSSENRTVNALLQKLVEDCLVDKKLMSDEDRRKPISRQKE